jgi:hypothetical protein
MQDLLGAWRMVRSHPFGVLLPAAVDLALGVLLFVHVGDAVRARGIAVGIATWVAARLLLSLLVVPLRGMRIVAGATAVGHPVAGVRAGPLLVVGAVAGLVRVVVLLVVAVPAIAAGLALADSGWIGTALGLAALGVIAAQVAALAAESILAGAPIEVVVGGKSSLRALRQSIVQAPAAALPRFLLLAAGRSAALTGALVCGAGALPGYPLDDLAVLHHWLRNFAPGVAVA